MKADKLPPSFFIENLWKELNRYNTEGRVVKTVTVTEENLANLYNSQYKDKTVYGEVFYYDKYHVSFLSVCWFRLLRFFINISRYEE